VGETKTIAEEGRGALGRTLARTQGRRLKGGEAEKSVARNDITAGR